MNRLRLTTRVEDVYLDTSVVVAAILPGGANERSSLDFCQYLVARSSRVFYSQTLLVELSQAIRKAATKSDRIDSRVRALFQLDEWEKNSLVRKRWMANGVEQFALLSAKFAEVIDLPFDESIWQQSIDLMVEHFLQAHDAVHAATARAYGLRTFATTDADFAHVDNLDVILLRDSAS